MTEPNSVPEVLSINIEDEMRNSYMDYAMSVIIGRALPEVRDGFKPVHRRILYAMYKEGLLSSKRYSKCAGVVGEVLKKYHPHGDNAVYDSLVRMAQPWNMRYPLIDGQGNFGSVDGDSAAAYRYTECRLTKIAEEMMADIEKETVLFVPNFDGSVEEPALLPTKIPNLLVNGSDGIAVGMATKIPPHNLGEITTALINLIDNPKLSFEELIKIVPGPDFPTAGIIQGRQGIVEAYRTGRGKVVMRAKAEIEVQDKTERESIIITELPFQTNKARILETIAELVSEDKIEGISDLRDESDRQGMRMVIELKKGAHSTVVLNQLYKHTALQSSFGVIMLTIVNNQPRVLPLIDMLKLFLKHRKEIIIRRTLFDLKEAEKRAHILEGLKIAVENIDEVIALIKASPSPEAARLGLMSRFELSELQAQAVLDMRLQKLTGLERDKIIAEYEEILKLILSLKEILGSETLIFGIIKQELQDVQSRFADDRRTQILDLAGEDIQIADLIQVEDMVVTVSHLGYVKRTPLTEYRLQKRGGKGSMGMTTRDEDFATKLFVASTHDTLLVFTSLGRVHWLKVYEIPEAARATKGKAINNLVGLSNGEKVAAILTVSEFTKDRFVIFATRSGTIKKTALEEYSRQRAGGILAIGLSDDELISVELSNGSQNLLISTAKGQSIQFSETDVRPMGRGASGVRGISLEEGDSLVSLDVVDPLKTILTLSERGYGKRTSVEDYRVQNRGGSGIITMKTTDKTGLVVSSSLVSDTDEIMLITNQGKTIRQPVKAISVIGRNTQGVRLIQVEENEKVVSATIIVNDDAVATNEPSQDTSSPQTIKETPHDE